MQDDVVTSTNLGYLSLVFYQLISLCWQYISANIVLLLALFHREKVENTMVHFPCFNMFYNKLLIDEKRRREMGFGMGPRLVNGKKKWRSDVD